MSDRPAIQVVWFTRDLRVTDHAPLANAAARGPVLPLYIVEPSLIHAAGFDSRHWDFVRASLIDLRRRLAGLGQPLVVRVGEAVDVLQALHAEAPFHRLWAHEVSGDRATRARDAEVRAWADATGVRFVELPSNGVIRGSHESATWMKRWNQRMRAPLVEPPAHIDLVPALDPGPIPDHADLGLAADLLPDAIRGGESIALRALTTFLDHQADAYGKRTTDGAMAGELTSRLSPYLAWGNLSGRQVAHATRERMRQLRNSPDRDANDWLSALTAFEAKLPLRCRAIQRMEDTPVVAEENVSRLFDGLREPVFDQDRFAAWAAGRTGYPLVDASMRALAAMGWLPFTLRAVVASFACNDLWLHWREPGLHLARMQIDTEPGILWTHLQAQAATDGGPLRIADPTRQARGLDPDGRFIRHWLPELTQAPAEHVHAPWQMPEATQQESGCVIGRDYPAPLVDHLTAAREARIRIAQRLGNPRAPAATGTGDRGPDNRSKPPKPTQLPLPLD